MVSYVYADLCSLLAATSQFSILIDQNMQFTGCHNGNKMRNATCADTNFNWVALLHVHSYTVYRVKYNIMWASLFVLGFLCILNVNNNVSSAGSMFIGKL